MSTSCPAKSHALDELSFVHFFLDNSIAMRQGEASQDSSFVSFNAANEAALAL